MSEPTDEKDNGGTETPIDIDLSDGAAPLAKKPKIKLLAGAGAGVVLLAIIATVIVVLIQPTAIQRAGDACSGTKPFEALLEKARETSTPSPNAESESPKANLDAIAEYFDGVIDVEDGGKTLIVNTKPQDDDILGLSSLALDCVYEQLDMPKHITERIGVTRALDGRQTGEWDNFTASWGYHPDNGMNLIIVQK